MRKEKSLIALLRGLVDLLVEESDRNPKFAARIEALLSGLPERKVRTSAPKSAHPSNPLPGLCRVDESGRGRISALAARPADFRIARGESAAKTSIRRAAPSGRSQKNWRNSLLMD
jgi:hypothetical protein